MLENAATETHDPASIAKAIEGMSEKDTFAAAELLFAIDGIAGSSMLTKEMKAASIQKLASDEFISKLGMLDKEIQSSLLYEVRLTENVHALADERLFTERAAGFFNSLGTEAASEWFNSIGVTGNVAQLTSGRVTEREVAAAIGGNGKVSSELSYAIGTTNEAEKLTERDFLGALLKLNPSTRADFLSGIWVSGNVSGLASPERVNEVANGASGIWKDLVRNESSDAVKGESRRILFALAGSEEHNRGALLNVQFLLNKGYDVIYAGNVENAMEVIRPAMKINADAIAFSVPGESGRQTLSDTAEGLRNIGRADITLLAGGAAESTAESLSHTGIKFFTSGSTPGDVINFLNSTAVKRQQPDQDFAISTTHSSHIYALADTGVQYTSTISRGKSSYSHEHLIARQAHQNLQLPQPSQYAISPVVSESHNGEAYKPVQTAQVAAEAELKEAGNDLMLQPYGQMRINEKQVAINTQPIPVSIKNAVIIDKPISTAHNAAIAKDLNPLLRMPAISPESSEKAQAKESAAVTATVQKPMSKSLQQQALAAPMPSAETNAAADEDTQKAHRVQKSAPISVPLIPITPKAAEAVPVPVQQTVTYANAPARRGIQVRHDNAKTKAEAKAEIMRYFRTYQRLSSLEPTPLSNKDTSQTLQKVQLIDEFYTKTIHSKDKNSVHKPFLSDFINMKSFKKASNWRRLC